MKVDVLNMKGEKVQAVELPAEIFEANVNIDLMHQAYIQQMANARLGTHKTKTRREVSGGSFQLETALTLEADPAIVLNISPDHMDRYGTLDDYATLAKARLLDLQPPGAHAVLNADDPPSRTFDAHVRRRRLLFSTRERLYRGAFLRGETLVLRTDHGEDDLCEIAQLPLRGEHNTANTLAAALACRLAGRTP